MSPKLLFVVRTMEIGGPTVSLLNLLSNLQEKGIECKVFVMDHSGEFLEELARMKALLPEDARLASIICDKKGLKRLGPMGYLRRSMFALSHHFFSAEKQLKKAYMHAAKSLEGFDCIIAYSENKATDFSCHVNADKRFAWMHTMFDRIAHLKTIEQWNVMYQQYERIFCVTEAAKACMQEYLPEIASKIEVIPNTLNASYIRNRANADCMYSHKAKYSIVSVGRLVIEKQYDIIAEVAPKLSAAGIDFSWSVVGDGPEYCNLVRLMEKNGVADKVTFLGALNNPYPVIKEADMLVITSKYEAQPMVANEALTLGVPVITTDYHSAKSVVTETVDGLICDNSAGGVLQALLDVFSSTEMLNHLKSGAKAFHYDNDNVLGRLKRYL